MQTAPAPESPPPAAPRKDAAPAAPGVRTWTTIGAVVLAWGMVLSLAYLSRERLFAMGSARRIPVDMYVAAATLALLALGVAWWTVRAVRAPRGQARPRGDSQWSIASRHFRRNKLAMAGLLVMLLLYVVTLLTPLISPYDPAAQGNIVLKRNLAPSLSVGGTVDGGGTFQRGEAVRLVARPDSGYIFAGWSYAGEDFATDTAITFPADANRVLVASFVPASNPGLGALSGSEPGRTVTLPPTQGAGAGPFTVAARAGTPHLMGTDKFGRDIFSRVLYGSRISLVIGFIAVGISITLGTLMGAFAGYYGGWVDTLLMRFTDMMLSFPRLVLLIVVIALFSPSIWLVVAVLGLTGWMGTARLVRGEVLSLREREFVQAARALGMGDGRIIFRHIIPNTMAPVIVSATLGIGQTILTEASLSFLGLGVQPPRPSWGNMVADGRDALIDAWWIATFPGIAIVITVIAFNLLGDGLRDALDPRLRT